MNPPSWFLRELEILDPSYFLVYNEEFLYWELKKEMDVDRKDKNTGKRVRVCNPTVAVFQTLNDDALLSLRRRKYDGLKYRQDSLEYIKEIMRHNKEAKAKAIEIAREQVAEGFIRIFNWGRKKYFLTPSKQAGGN